MLRGPWLLEARAGIQILPLPLQNVEPRFAPLYIGLDVAVKIGWPRLRSYAGASACKQELVLYRRHTPLLYKLFFGDVLVWDMKLPRAAPAQATCDPSFSGPRREQGLRRTVTRRAYQQHLAD